MGYLGARNGKERSSELISLYESKRKKEKEFKDLFELELFFESSEKLLKVSI